MRNATEAIAGVADEESAVSHQGCVGVSIPPLRKGVVLKLG